MPVPVCFTSTTIIIVPKRTAACMTTAHGAQSSWRLFMASLDAVQFALQSNRSTKELLVIWHARCADVSISFFGRYSHTGYRLDWRSAVHWPYKHWQQPIHSLLSVTLDYPIKSLHATSPSQPSLCGDARPVATFNCHRRTGSTLWRSMSQ